ncbi:MAG: cation transporter [Spirochaetaceae bacterium]|jgi:Co/Zn/Cd efflux system component|nr:cation transporter [Spirochaetaceae bacterium]
MERTVFNIKHMDCPAEEQMVRMKLAGFPSVKKLIFNLEGRNLTVFHEGGLEAIKAAITSLNFGDRVTESGLYDGVVITDDAVTDKKLLWTVLIINFSVFAGEIIFGLLAQSMGLVADALDELSDAFVYGLSLYAITGTLLVKKRVARISGVLQLALAAWGFVEVVRRFIEAEAIPNPLIMVVLSCFALAGNTASLILLGKSKTKEVHIKSSQIFTSDDIIANIGVIAAAILVYFSQSRIPDLVIGTVVFSLVLCGAVAIFKLAK